MFVSVSCLRNYETLIGMGVMNDLLNFLRHNGGELCGTRNFPGAVKFGAAAAARGGDAKRQQKKNDNNHSSDKNPNHHP